MVLADEISYLAGTEQVQVVSQTLIYRVERGGTLLAAFFGNLRLGEVAPHEVAEGSHARVASLLDIAGAKALAVQQRPKRGMVKVSLLRRLLRRQACCATI